MKTYEMYAKAIEDGKTYRASDMFYNREKGFHDDDGYIWSWEAYSHHRDGYDAFLSEDGWEEVAEERLFTLEEIKNAVYDFVEDYYMCPQNHVNELIEGIFSKGRRG
jgi:uncharacterized protein CbrC (UPF0167 family)